MFVPVNVDFRRLFFGQRKKPTTEEEPEPKAVPNQPKPWRSLWLGKPTADATKETKKADTEAQPETTEQAEIPTVIYIL